MVRSCLRHGVACHAVAALAAVGLFALPGAASAGTATLEVGLAGGARTESSSIGSGVSSNDIADAGRINERSWSSGASFIAYPSGDAEVDTLNAANAAAIARATVNNSDRRYTLTPSSEGKRFDGGKLVIFASLVDGDIAGDGSLEMKLDATAYRVSWPNWPSGSDQTPVIRNRPGSEDIELRAEIALPQDLDSTASIFVDISLLLKATADVSASGGAVVTAQASAKSRITAFAVFNAAGTQVTGFRLAGSGKALTERVAPPPQLLLSVEYFNESLRTFFITANPDEIKSLDAGGVWKRTGETFQVYATADSGRLGVCRFFGEFPQPSGPAKSSHFYALRGEQCDGVKTPPWQFEGVVFFMPPPDATGSCPSGTTSVYRLYNDGRGGVPNHRFTTSLETVGEMKRDGYIDEGVAMCSPL
jgi:hypothetical protein